VFVFIGVYRGGVEGRYVIVFWFVLMCVVACWCM